MAIPIQEKIKVILKLLAKPKELNALISLKHSGYLQEIGWFNAFSSMNSVGSNNEPIPWVTYSFNSFILPRLNKELTVFEYGSGNSTLFYSKYVNKVTSVEHSKEWRNKISKKAPANAEIKYVPEASYAESIKTTDDKFDIIIVDAIERVECMKLAPQFLSYRGVVVLDDSEREEYAEGIEFLKNNGFKSIEFWGISPGLFIHKCTTVFYKQNNCLEI